MRISTRFNYRAATLALAAGVLLPGAVAAQSQMPSPGTWQFGGSIYAYLPTISGNTSFPTTAGAPSIDVSADQILGALKMTFMGTLSATNGRWGGFTDVIYLDVGGSKSNTTDYTIGGSTVPASGTADLNLDLKTLIWTLGFDYRLATTPNWTFDAFIGSRMAQMKQEANWSITGNLGTIVAPPRTGSSSVEATNWDGLLGVKGRYKFGDASRWSIPFYVDVGTGDSDLTWQAATGVTYAFNWGEAGLLWRYLEYQMKSDVKIQELKLNGPMLGVAFRW